MYIVVEKFPMKSHCKKIMRIMVNVAVPDYNEVYGKCCFSTKKRLP